MGLVQTQDGGVCFMGEDGGGGDVVVTATGTDGSVASGSSIMFKTASDSNVVVKVSEGENGEVVAEVGVYYA